MRARRRSAGTAVISPNQGFTPWLVAATLLGCQCHRSAAGEGAVSLRTVSSTVSSVAGHQATAPVFDAKEDAVRASLAEAEIERVELGKGGRSVSFRITLEDGTVGYFKPEQDFAAHWYAELAAYYVDRSLGLGRVPPAIGRRIPWAVLEPVAKRSSNADEIVVQPDGTVRGAFVWWVPERLVKLDPPEGWEAWLSIEPPPAVSPFQRARDYRRALDRAAKAEPERPPAPPPPTFADRPAELSDLVVFDFLMDNADRWGGGFTNVRTRGAGGPLVFLDNAGGLHRGREPDARAKAQLRTVQRMRASTISALQRLDVQDLKEAMAEDPLAPVLQEAHLQQIEERRQQILQHAEKMRFEHGDAATPW